MTNTIKTIRNTLLIIAIAAVSNNSNAQTTGFWDLNGNTGTVGTNFIGTIDNVSFRIKTNNAVRMIITGKGKIGIGTTSPNSIVDIVKSGTSDLNVKSSNGHAKIIIDRGSLDSSAIVEYRSLGGSGFGNTWQMGTTQGLDGDFIINCVGTNDTAIRIVKSTGNIGIGGRATSSKLYVEGSTEIAGQIKSNGEIVNGIVDASGVKVGGLTLAGGSPASGLVLTSTGGGSTAWQSPAGGITGTGTNGNVTFWNGTSSLSSSSILFWDQGNSRLGIGTNTPQARLDVNGSVRLTAGSPAAGLVLTASDNLGNATWQPAPGAGSVSGSGLASRIAYWTGNSTVSNALNLAWDNTNQRMGIGNTSPNVRLHISGGTDASLTSGTGYVVIGSMTSVNVVYDDNEILARNNGTNSTLSLNASGGNVVVNGSGSGFLGIGMTPSFQLHLSTNSAAKPTSSSWTVSSDERLKKNVFDFTDGLNIVKKIHPVWFNYNGKAGMPTDERGVGTIAQEIQKISPYMIKEWTYENKDGGKEKYLGVDYGAMDFILINSIKEQQQQIDSKNEIISQQQKDIDDLKSKFASMENALSQCCMNYKSRVAGSEIEGISKKDFALLEQNIPNPFSENTIIRFYIPQNTNSVLIKIYALDGSELKSIPVSSKGFGQTEISGKTLSAGTYTYMLIADGKVVDTKQMVLTR